MEDAGLRSRIRKMFGTQENFARALGLSGSAVSKRLSGKTEWRIEEVAKASELLGIPLRDAPEFFFYQIVKKS